MLDTKEEKKYSQLRKLGQELHIPTFEAFLELEVTKDGKLIQRHKQRSHSWVRNAYNHMVSSLAQVNATDNTYEAGKLSIKDQGGVVKFGNYPITCPAKSSDMSSVGKGYTAGAGLNTSGIQAGASDDVETFEDYYLHTLIANGTGAGQLTYAASEPYAISYNAGTKVLTVTLVRYLNNNTIGLTDVDVKEVGLVIAAAVMNVDTIWLQSRDKLGATITLPSTGQLKVTYTLEITYPA